MTRPRRPTHDTADTSPDTGCGGLCTRSLDCPFESCIHDDPGVMRAYLRTGREALAAEILGLVREGRGHKEIAERVGVSIRTVGRIKEGARG